MRDRRVCLIQLNFFFVIYISILGFTEKSIALFQALIEYLLFRPPDKKNYSTEENLIVRKKRFQEFWESENPRIGDEVFFIF